MVDYFIIEGNHEQYKQDPDVNKSRLFYKFELEEAIIGTTINDAGNRVFVYHDEKVTDIFA